MIQRRLIHQLAESLRSLHRAMDFDFKARYHEDCNVCALLRQADDASVVADEDCDCHLREAYDDS